MLNNQATVFDAEPQEKLLEVLRREKLYKVKCGCMEGHCGNCYVLIDNKPVPSCIVPVAVVRDSSIVTLEYFKNYPEYNDIMTGFKDAGINLCGYCDSGKILTAYQLLKATGRPSVKQIDNAIKNLDFCCTDHDTLINGILYAIAAKHRREGKKHGRK